MDRSRHAPIIYILIQITNVPAHQNIHLVHFSGEHEQSVCQDALVEEWKTNADTEGLEACFIMQQMT